MDGQGQLIRLSRPAHRIVTLTPHAAELVVSAGAGTALVAVTAESDYPASVRALPKIGRYNQISLSAILRQRPDLVVAWQDGGTHKEVTRLRQLGIPVFISHPLQPSDISKEIRALGQLSGHSQTAHNNTRAFDQALQQLSRRYGSQPAVKTVVLLSEAPIYSVSKHSFIGQMLPLCGGANVFAELASPAPQINREAIIRAQPQVILVASEGKMPTQLASWPIPAARKQQIYPLRDSARPSLRLLQPLQQMCADLDRARRDKH